MIQVTLAVKCNMAHHDTSATELNFKQLAACCLEMGEIV
jgi:hypothetical protein